MRRLASTALLRRCTIALTVLAVLGLSAAAFAFWRGQGSGTASGSVGTLSAPVIGTLTPGPGTAEINWSAVTPPGSGAVSYYVSRDGGSPAGNCPTASAPGALTSCTDSGVSAGAHEYTVTAVWRSWTARSGAASVEVASAAATRLALEASSTTPTAGAPDSLTITAKDASNKTVTSYSGTKSLTFGGASAIGSFQPTVTDSSGTARSFGAATAITFNNGVAAVAGANNGAMTLYKAQTATIVVSDGTIGNGGGLSVAVGPATAASFSLGTPATQTAGSAFEATLTALDAYGNTATGYTGSKTIAFSGPSSSANGTAPKYPASVSFGAGIGTASITLYKAESTTLSAKDGSIGATSGSFTVSPATAAGLSLSAASSTPTAGEADNLSIVASDAYGNAATGYTGPKKLTFGGASAVGANTPTVSNSSGSAVAFGTATLISFANGSATVSGASNGVMKLYAAGSSKITVTDGTINNGTGLSVTVAPAAIATIALTTPATQTAGAAFNLAITAKDTYGNGAAGSQALTFSGPSSSPNGTAPTYPATVSFASGSGTAPVTLTDAQSTTITVKQGAVGATSGSFTVNPATAASLSLSAASTTPTAGVADNLTIAALDSFGNTASAYTGAKNLTFGGASTIGVNKPTVTNSSGGATAFGSATAIAFSNGLATVSGSNNGVMKLYSAETAKVTVTDGTINNGGGLSIAVKAAAATTMAFVNCATTANPSNPTCAGQPIKLGNKANMTFNMQTQDSFGNPASPTAALSITFTNTDATFTISSGEPAAIGTAATTSAQVTLHHENNGATDTLTAKASGFANATLSAEK
jgi:hypothetical protein